MCLAKIKKSYLILLFSLFLLLFMTPLYFLVLFIDLTVQFQLTFTFIYSIFSKKKKNQFQQNKLIPNRPLVILKKQNLFYNNMHVKMENHNLNNITFLEAHHYFLCFTLYSFNHNLQCIRLIFLIK